MNNCLQHGCGALNIDGCRIGAVGGTARSGQAAYPKTLDGKEDRSGSWARTGHDIVEISMGRWPANVLLGSEGVLENGKSDFANSEGASRYFKQIKSEGAPQ